MVRLLRWPGAFTLALLLFALAADTAAAQEQVQLPVGESKGVRLVRQHGALAFVFTKRADRLHRRIAGKTVLVSCTDLEEERHLGGQTVQNGFQKERVPRKGRVLRTGDLSSWDYCRLYLPARTVKHPHNGTEHISRRELVAIPLTQTGAVRLDGQRKVLRLTILLELAGLIADERHTTNWPTFEQLPARARDALKIVALADPADSPPPGTIGYYSDGQQHAAAVILMATGRRLFIEFDADDVYRTNTLQYGYLGD